MNPEILRFLSYNPNTGKLYWLPRKPEDFNTRTRPKEGMCLSWNKRYANTEAFTAVGNHGYHTGAIRNKNFLAHRVIFFIVEGRWPDGFVDHVNGCRTDNRWINLRDVDCAESAKNVSMRSDNTTGCVGVYKVPSGRWLARVKSDGVFDFLGTFDTFEEACIARKQGEIKHGFHKNFGRIKP